MSGKKQRGQLTPKQAAFCMAYLETGNASEAYRRSYAAQKMLPTTIHRKACDLLKNEKVAQQVRGLQQEAQKRHEVTVDELIAELEAARIAAMQGDKPQLSVAVSAVMGKARMLGFLVDKQEVKGSLEGQIELKTELTLEPSEAYKRMLGKR